MINFVIEWLRDNFHWSATAETYAAFDALRDGDHTLRDDESERAAIRDTIRQQQRDTSAFYIPLL